MNRGGFPVKNCPLSIVFAAAIAVHAHADSIQVLNGDAHFPESPVWYHSKLYYVEYDRNTVTAWDGKKNAIFWSQEGCGPSAVAPTVRGDLVTTWVKIDSKGQIYVGQNPRDVHAPLAGTVFVVNADGQLLRKLTLLSPGVPNLAFSPDEKTVYVTALDQIDKPPYPRQDLLDSKQLMGDS